MKSLSKIGILGFMRSIMKLIEGETVGWKTMYNREMKNRKQRNLK